MLYIKITLVRRNYCTLEDGKIPNAGKCFCSSAVVEMAVVFGSFLYANRALFAMILTLDARMVVAVPSHAR